MTAIFQNDALLGKKVLVKPSNPYPDREYIGNIRGVTLQPALTMVGEEYPPGVWFLIEYQDGRFGEAFVSETTLIK